MATSLNSPLFTKVFDRASDFQPTQGSAYVFGLLEERSSHLDAWREGRPDVLLVEISELERPFVSSTIQNGDVFSMRRLDDLRRFFAALGERPIYIDITGLSHHVWAPLLKVGIEARLQIKVVYVEPASYRYSPNPMKGDIYDLSERIDGIEPIPLFAILDDPSEESVSFVALLGFEGARFAHVLEEIDPPGAIIPIIGVPGFRVEYPFNAYIGNQTPLLETRSWHGVYYARANCPFDLFQTLAEIRDARPPGHLKIALIGTKPHSLGAILFAICKRSGVEIVYDHPKRKQRRTSGTMQCLVYSVSDFLAGNPQLELAA